MTGLELKSFGCDTASHYVNEVAPAMGPR